MRKGLGGIVWSLILISAGILFLLGNVFPELRPWRLIARYWSAPWLLFAQFWPAIIIAWGISKLASYLRSDQDPAAGRRSLLSGGDLVLLVFLLIAGTTATSLTKAFHNGFFGWKSQKEGFHFDPEDWDFADSRPTFEFSAETSQPVGANTTTLEVVNRFGNVTFFVHNLPTIKVKLQEKVRAEDEARGREISNQLKIVMDRKDRGFSLSTNRESLPDEWRRGLETHFTVWVPKTMTITLSNEHGQVSLDGISGSHSITNAHGSVTIRNVDGSLRVENRHGPVNVSAITGDCSIKNKYGAIQVETIGGKTEIENAHGPVDLRQLKGGVNLSNRYGRIACIDLEGGLIIDGKHAEVRGQNIGGDVQVATAYQSVELENVLGSISVKGQHGDIAIKNSQPQVKPIVIDAEYSGVDITLPKESRFELDASSKYGKFVSGFESVNLSESTAGKNLRVRGSNGTGGPSITIHTSYRSISLNPS
jgi:putative adhesin